VSIPKLTSDTLAGSRLWRGPLRRRDLRLFWFGETTSKLGSSVSTVALPLVAVVTLHAGALVVSSLVAAEWLPWLLIGLPVGAWVDRLPRRRLMLTADALSLVLFASVPIAAWLGVLTVVQLLAVALLAGAASVFLQTGYQVYLPSLVRERELAQANALMQGSEAASQVVGPGVAGALAAAVGAVSGMMVDAVSFLVSAVCLLSIRAKEPRLERAGRAPKLGRDIAEGLRFVARDPYLRPLTIAGAISNLGLVGYQSVLIVFLVRIAGITPGLVGALIALASFGGVIGAACATHIARRFGSARGYLICELVAPSAALLIPLTAAGPRVALFVVGGLVVVAGVVAGNVIKGAWRQLYCPRELLGRVITSSQLLNYGVIPVGALFAGILASVVGVHASLWIMTGSMALSPVVLFFSQVRKRTEFPAPPAE
jgi:MFS family permease